MNILFNLELIIGNVVNCQSSLSMKSTVYHGNNAEISRIHRSKTNDGLLLIYCIAYRLKTNMAAVNEKDY
jgi:hypothetical protein